MNLLICGGVLCGVERELQHCQRDALTIKYPGWSHKCQLSHGSPQASARRRCRSVLSDQKGRIRQ
jgi:hypothetical protein